MYYTDKEKQYRQTRYLKQWINFFFSIFPWGCLPHCQNADPWSQLTGVWTPKWQVHSTREKINKNCWDGNNLRPVNLKHPVEFHQDWTSHKDSKWAHHANQIIHIEELNTTYGPHIKELNTTNPCHAQCILQARIIKIISRIFS